MLNVLLHRLAHIRLILMQISLANLILVYFREHVYAMQALDALLKLFVVVQVVVQHFVDLILELLLVIGLLTDLLN